MKKNSTKPSGPSQRQLRVGEQLRQIIAEVMQRGHFRDPALIEGASFVTVTEVRPSPDLKQATAYIIPLGGKDIEIILPALNDSAAIFQKEINKQSTMKFTPRIRFKMDTSFDNVQKLENILGKITYSDQE
ncbi:MAG: 30S ribosome-binding factor RbfA [Alphaproteobacteria bacterium]|nr:30S ribosome-binding factor RbfA [Alphaproteobacteria bacterium]NCQ87918.1 30S ribosome-binding factor RbfA [Alphaproteobacteria bacterium]NCT05575.1 30S ribosome-binding factor RbfA [Alphaproteobacteria bacterium]